VPTVTIRFIAGQSSLALIHTRLLSTLAASQVYMSVVQLLPTMSMTCYISQRLFGQPVLFDFVRSVTYFYFRNIYSYIH